MSLPAPETLYLDGGFEPICVILHAPAAAARRDTAVIFCPPFGWDEICAYRSLRDWAQRLAAAGYACVRLSFPGTGDSGGSPRDPGRLEAWTAAIDVAGHWVRAVTGARRVVALGIDLGGVIACRAAAAGAPIDDFVLWGTPARAGAIVRQLRAFSKLETSKFFEGLEPPPPLAAGELEAGGFLLSAETVQALDGLDLAAAPLGGAFSRRVLMLERDGIAVDARLRQHLENCGARVTIAAGNGYGSMTSHPQRARPPLELIERVTAWLDDASNVAGPDAGRSSALPAGACTSAEIQIDGVRVKETPLTFEQSFGCLAGVLAEPLGYRHSSLCAVFLNAGAVRRVGPNRMWVEVARRWAARGVPTLRLDVKGIGDADGDTTPYAKDGSLYVREIVPDVLATLDALQARGAGERFVLAGLCAGAYWSFHAALQDPRVSTALMLNPQRLFWDPDLGPARDFRALLANPTGWSKMREQASRDRVRSLALWMLAAPKRARVRGRASGSPGSPAGDEIDDAFERLHATGKRVTLLFSNHEPLHEEFIRSSRISQLQQFENVTFEYIPVRDHTLRPNWSQQQAHAALDRALDRELGVSQAATLSTARTTRR